jgi:competence protein ComEA
MKSLATCLALAAICVFAADEKDAGLLPDGEGKALVGRVCIDCHASGNFRRARLTKDQWEESVADMVDRGAKATDEEVNTIVAYLEKNFGKGAKVQMNSAPLVEIKVVLGFTVPESQAVVDYREKNGGIKSFEDLAKIPGVDPAKVESARDRMAF